MTTQLADLEAQLAARENDINSLLEVIKIYVPPSILVMRCTICTSVIVDEEIYLCATCQKFHCDDDSNVCELCDDSFCIACDPNMVSRQEDVICFACSTSRESQESQTVCCASNGASRRRVVVKHI
jgi:hypothetical protein